MKFVVVVIEKPFRSSSVYYVSVNDVINKLLQLSFSRHIELMRRNKLIATSFVGDGGKLTECQVDLDELDQEELLQTLMNDKVNAWEIEDEIVVSGYISLFNI